jgi:hypothetical protein
MKAWQTILIAAIAATIVVIAGTVAHVDVNSNFFLVLRFTAISPNHKNTNIP